jgi:hypothetical protein
VARYREHQLGDVSAAIEACHAALAAVDRARMWGRAAPAVERDLAYRLARLRRKSSRARAERAVPAKRVA